jgi:NAD(P)-dependent dehydrogenase (short-subunit alcohol dehydrogenase family)
VKQQKGRIDILFANAGVGEFSRLAAITEGHFDKTFGINVRAIDITARVLSGVYTLLITARVQ